MSPTGVGVTMCCTFVHMCGASLTTLDYRLKPPKLRVMARKTGPETEVRARSSG